MRVACSRVLFRALVVDGLSRGVVEVISRLRCSIDRLSETPRCATQSGKGGCLGCYSARVQGWGGVNHCTCAYRAFDVSVFNGRI